MYVPQFIASNRKRLKTNKIIPNNLSKNVNAGLMLFEPNLQEFCHLLTILKKYRSPKLRFPEQQFLGYYYENKVHLIDPLYYCNLEYPQCNNECYGIKFLSSVKPWNKNKKSYDECDLLWYNIYKNIE